MCFNLYGFSFVHHNPVLVKTAQQVCPIDAAFMVAHQGYNFLRKLTGIHLCLAYFPESSSDGQFSQNSHLIQTLLMVILSNTILSSESCSMLTPL